MIRARHLSIVVLCSNLNGVIMHLVQTCATAATSNLKAAGDGWHYEDYEDLVLEAAGDLFFCTLLIGGFGVLCRSLLRFRFILYFQQYINSTAKHAYGQDRKRYYIRSFNLISCLHY